MVNMRASGWLDLCLRCRVGRDTDGDGNCANCAKLPRKPLMEVEALKHAWIVDPIFDLEDAEGFEAHRGELYLFRIETELRWAKKSLDLRQQMIDNYRKAHRELMGE
jgi:hypothetical protein